MSWYGFDRRRQRDAEAVEDLAERVVGEGVGVPLRHDDHGLARFAELAELLFLLGAGREPARVDLVVFGVWGADGRGEAEELGGGEFAGFGLALELGVLREGFGADVGGEELGVSMFEAEVGGRGVAEELVGAGDDLRAEGGHAGFVAGVRVRIWVRRVERRQPVEAPLEGADDAVGVSGGERGLPGKHPFGVEPAEHCLSV